MSTYLIDYFLKVSYEVPSLILPLKSVHKHTQNSKFHNEYGQKSVSNLTFKIVFSV